MMKYKAGYKYQLYEDCKIKIGIKAPINASDKYSQLDALGNLTIKAGYAWDGCTGMIDTNSNMEAGLVHDCLYQMLREALIPNYKTIAILDRSKCLEKFKRMRSQVDDVFATLLEAGGCWRITVFSAPRVVKLMGEKYALPKILHKLKE